MKILDGKKTSQNILGNIQEEIDKYIKLGKRVPRLDILLVGNDFASKKYVEMKSKRAMQLGIKCLVHSFDENINPKVLVDLIEELNINGEVDGIMVQLPLPKEIEKGVILEKILPSKDVDGLTSVNLGKLFKNDSFSIPPATARGILLLLKEYNIKLDGMNAVVVGRSDIVGLPTAAILQNENCTVTVCHSHTRDLIEICKSADILVTGIGKAKYFNSEYLKEGCIVIDVGTNKDETGVLVGDVDFDNVKDKVEYITPVPGGVGPMTISSLILNLVEIYQRNV